MPITSIRYMGQANHIKEKGAENMSTLERGHIKEIT
jgi:hypothetical protein